MGRVAAIGHGRDEGQLYANCALRPAVPECPLAGHLRLALSWQILGFPQASNAAGGHIGGHCQVELSKPHYKTAQYAYFWFPFTRSSPPSEIILNRLGKWRISAYYRHWPVQCCPVPSTQSKGVSGGLAVSLLSEHVDT